MQRELLALQRLLNQFYKIKANFHGSESEEPNMFPLIALKKKEVICTLVWC